jgi:hypothetical protein
VGLLYQTPTGFLEDQCKRGDDNLSHPAPKSKSKSCTSASPLHSRGTLVMRLWRVIVRLRLKCDGHAQKPDFVFRRNGRVHLSRHGASVQSTTGSRGVRIRGSNAGYTMFRGSVKSTGYPLHSPVSLSLPLPCVTVCHHISTGLYLT